MQSQWIVLTASLAVATACRKSETSSPWGEHFELISGGEYLGQRIACPKLQKDREDVLQLIVPYRIDHEVVSCTKYRSCVDARACPKLDHGFCTADIVNARMDQATAYCAWRRRRLPTYAQWSRAIRGVKGSKHPNGDSSVECARPTTTSESAPRCKHVSTDNVEYGVRNFNGNELTRDVGCNEFVSGPVSADLTGIELDKVRFGSNTGEFRCVKDSGVPATVSAP